MKITLIEPPVGVDYALQKGSGHDYECEQLQRSIGNDLNFEFTIELKKTKAGEPDFGGPFVQGKTGERFVYIDIGTAARQFHSEWSRRLKIPLTGITTAMIGTVLNHANKALETRVPGKAKDGSPNCATVKPFSGWNVS